MKASKPARSIATWAHAAFAAVCGFAYSGMALALEWNLQPAGSKLADDIHGLHEYVMLLCTVIFVGVFAFMFYAVYAHRKSKGHKAAQFHENTTVEILWTVIPAIILVVIAWPTTRTVVAQKDTSNPDLTIKVTGYQWKWGYDYVKGEGEGISFVSTLATPRDQIENKAPKGEHYLLEVDNELVVPVGKKIRMLTTAADVIHSWWVPAFGAKQDAIPGFIRDLWFRRREDRHLPQPVRRAVRQGARLHADRGQGGEPGGVQQVGRRPAEADRRRGRRSEQDLHDGRTEEARRAGLRQELRRLPPGRPARARRPRSRRSTARRS